MSKQPKDQKKKIQFTPALQKLFNRICARVYRGNPRKKCSKDTLLSVQHSQMIRKNNFGTTVTTCRPTYQTHNYIRNKQIFSETGSSGNPSSNNIQMKKLSSYWTERTTNNNLDKPFRCKTQSIKFVSSAYLSNKRQTSPDFIVDNDLLQARQNKNKQTIKNRGPLKTENWSLLPSQFCSEIIKTENKGFPCRMRQMQDKRKINNLIKTKNKLAAELGKHQREQSFFKPWDVEQNDDLFF